ncbi:MAG: cupin domain-containing protein [Alphaproteobacteria bacterium]|nr:cupin domain-containing protein [Alphaproteobacteria bacterium]
MPRAAMSADEIITHLRMKPHPEGGHYVETFRDLPVGDRARSTAIYFLLRAGENSHWHHVDAVEFWLWHAGAPLALSVSADGDMAYTLRLSGDLAAGHMPQAVVPAGAWQAAEALGDWSLVSCIVAPGFRFSGFKLAPPGWAPKHWRPVAR